MSTDLPPGAEIYLPVLAAEIRQHWADAPLKSFMAGQVEQETCISLKHRKCWSPAAELKTAREYGFGLGQITVTDRFNNFIEARKLDSSLSGWQWEDRYNATYQLRTMVLTDRLCYYRFSWAADPYERVALCLAAYNGGTGGVLQERKICAVTHDCDNSKWFGNIEYTSRKSREPAKGYGKSFFEINREYPRNILTIRRHKYVPHLENKGE